MKRPTAAFAAALTVLGLVLASYTNDHPKGPAGRVIAKDTDRDCHTTGSGKKRHRSCHTEYELTTRDSDGQDHEFEVPAYVYDNCRRGSAYPGCINR